MTQVQGFQRVLVAVDFSDSSHHALEVARQRFSGSNLMLVHVIDTRSSTVPDMMGGLTAVRLDAELLEQQQESNMKQLLDWTREGEEHQQIVGEPISGILQAADHWEADLIVVGTHDRSFLEQLLLGSSAEKIVERSLVPVLTVRFSEP